MPTTTAWARPQRSSTMMQTLPAATHSKGQQRPPTHHLRLQKQLSFTETHTAQHNGNSRNDRLLPVHKAGNGYLRRGLSVDRSLESIRESTHKSTASYEVQSKRLTKPVKYGCDRVDTLKNRKSIESNELGCVRAGSTSSILKSLDYELKQVNSQLEQHYNCKSLCDPVKGANITGAEGTNNKLSSLPTTSEHQTNPDNSTSTLKNDCNKVNLSIVLSHVINFNKTNSNDSNNSDIESCSESVETKPKITPSTRTLRTDLPERARIESAASVSANTATIPNSNITANATVHQRRAQFRSSRNLTINASNNGTASAPVANNVTIVSEQIEQTSNSSGAILNTAPSLIVQRRPPLVRAMSAPVRSRSLDENSKGVFTFQKRKLRRRKLITRNASVCDNNDADTLGGGVGGGEIGAGRGDKNDILFDLNAISSKKTPITRTRSTLAVDVITLVSLVSSEGSDSEKEDSAPETVRGNAERSRSTGAPSLRKTGKSVSFQENYPPNFQLATKEYSHMIRRGSIVPFAARLRSNRPPTAPPVSIFMPDTTTSNTMPTSPSETAETNSSNDTNANLVAESPKNANEPGCDGKQNEEYAYPEYVRSLKERECWKLYRKMSIKGVSVSYDTVLRGMLTPTEFRQIQKQREIEEAKVRALEEEKESAVEVQNPTSAVDRLTQKLLKK